VLPVIAPWILPVARDNYFPGCRTNNVFACVNGSGVYKSVNGGTAFTELNSSCSASVCLKNLPERSRIPLVDNDDAVRETVEHLIRSLGYEPINFRRSD
jgi:hypothetical protein